MPPRYHTGLEAEKASTIELRIPYKAYPACTASWYKDDEPISSGGKYSMETDDKFVVLRISNAAREDAGEYRVVAHNNVGSDSGSVRVTVADRPEAPRFPIVENILDEAVILSWKPPNLDGGSLVTGYIIEKRESGTGQWVPCARSRFTYFTVEGLKPRHSYEFRILAENKHGISDPCEPTAPVEIPVNRARRREYDGECCDAHP